jgi:hypothetical protein
VKQFVPKALPLRRLQCQSNCAGAVSHGKSRLVNKHWQGPSKRVVRKEGRPGENAETACCGNPTYDEVQTGQVDRCSQCEAFDTVRAAIRGTEAGHRQTCTQ